MILNEFPDLQWLKKQANQRFENRKRWDGVILPNEGWPSVILNTKTTHTYRDNIKGPLSIFTNLSGESFVRAGNKNMFIQDGNFGISNAAEEYTLEIDSLQQTETFNIHFGDSFVRKAYASLLSSDINTEGDQLIPALHNRIAALDTNAKNLLIRIKTLNSTEALLEEELLFSMFSWLIKEDSKVKKAAAKLSVIKKSTREEITNRLLLSTDYIYAYYSQDLSLEELAQTACLSKFHFLRLFKTIFNKTPHQFINEVRVHYAKDLLKRSSINVNEIAVKCGFANPSAFSRMFYSHVGLYPNQFRMKN